MKIESAIAYAELLLMESDDKALTISRPMLNTLTKNAAPRIEPKRTPSLAEGKLKKRVERQAQTIMNLEAENRYLQEELNRWRKKGTRDE